jgi:hypothetical protein
MIKNHQKLNIDLITLAEIYRSTFNLSRDKPKTLFNFIYQINDLKITTDFLSSLLGTPLNFRGLVQRGTDIEFGLKLLDYLDLSENEKQRLGGELFEELDESIVPQINGNIVRLLFGDINYNIVPILLDGFLRVETKKKLLGDLLTIYAKYRQPNIKKLITEHIDNDSLYQILLKNRISQEIFVGIFSILQEDNFFTSKDQALNLINNFQESKPQFDDETALTKFIKQLSFFIETVSDLDRIKYFYSTSHNEALQMFHVHLKDKYVNMIHSSDDYIRLCNMLNNYLTDTQNDALMNAIQAKSIECVKTYADYIRIGSLLPDSQLDAFKIATQAFHQPLSDSLEQEKFSCKEILFAIKNMANKAVLPIILNYILKFSSDTLQYSKIDLKEFDNIIATFVNSATDYVELFKSLDSNLRGRVLHTFEISKLIKSDDDYYLMASIHDKYMMTYGEVPRPYSKIQIAFSIFKLLVENLPRNAKDHDETLKFIQQFQLNNSYPLSFDQYMQISPDNDKIKALIEKNPLFKKAYELARIPAEDDRIRQTYKAVFELKPWGISHATGSTVLFARNLETSKLDLNFARQDSSAQNTRLSNVISACTPNKHK